MLQTVRKYTQGWVATVIGSILSLAFVFWGIENYLMGSSKRDLVAKVNGKEISLAELNNDFQRAVVRLKDQAGINFNLPPLMQQDLKIQALENMVMETTLEQAALKAGFRVTPQETSAMIKQMPVFQENGGFSRDRLDQVLTKLSYTQNEFFADVSKSLLLNQVASGLIGSEFILSNELNQAIALVEQKRDIEYAVIPLTQFKKEAKVSAEDMKIYYLQHKNQFKIPAKLQIEYVQLTLNDLKKTITVTEQDMNNYFSSNSDLDRKNPKVLAKAKEALLQQKADEAFLAASDKLTDLAFTHPNSLTNAANTLNLKINTTDYFTQRGGNSVVTKNPKVIAAAFNADILKERTNSNLIELAPGNILVIRVKDYKPEAFAALNDVQDKIKHALVDVYASKEAKEKAKTIVAKLKNKDDFIKLMASEHLTVATKQHASRHEKNINPDILKLAFSMPLHSKTPVAGVQLANGDCVVVLVKNVIDFDTSKITDEQRMMMTKLYSDTYGKLNYNLYVENQMSKAKIKIYQRK